MKIKNLSKKLKLNKKTVSNLNNIDMKDVYGGTGQSFFTCRHGCETKTGDPCIVC